ncbi:MAG: MBL fold metallo-hydrolase [Thermomicrobiales bacterium]
MLTLTFLGTGTSNGVPMIGCECDVCTSTDPRDFRNRTSAYLVWGNLHLLIDTATELRLQALNFGIREVDAVLFTHAHADHTGGFDELRRFNELAQAHLPVYAGPDTAAVLRERFAYAFEDIFPFYGGKPDLTLHEVRGPFEIQGKTIVPIPVVHGRTNVLGYRFGPLAYVTDAKIVPEESVELLQGVDTLVINALRQETASNPSQLQRGSRAHRVRFPSSRLPHSSFSRNEPHRRLCPPSGWRRGGVRRPDDHRGLTFVLTGETVDRSYW